MGKRGRYKMTFGEQVKKYRLEKGLKRPALSKKIGYSSSYIKDIETNRCNIPNKNIIDKIIHGLDCSINKEKELWDKAGETKSPLNPLQLPYDVIDFIKENREMISTLCRKKIADAPIVKSAQNIDNVIELTNEVYFGLIKEFESELEQLKKEIVTISWMINRFKKSIK